MAKLTLEQGRFRLDRLTRALSWLLPISGGMMAVTLLADGPFDGMALLPSVMGPFTVVALVGAAVTVVLACMWFHRANANLRASGISLLHGPTMAWLWAFVPIAALFKPFQVMREIWSESLGLSHGHDAPAPPLMTQWWGAWVVAQISMNLSGSRHVAGTDMDRFVLTPLAALAGLCACLLFRTLIRDVNAAQQGMADAAVFA
jgi:hypothetical protein